VPGARELDGALGELGEVHRLGVGHLAVRVHGGVQHVVDGGVQAVHVLAHRAIELLAPALRQVAELEGVEIELERGHRRLELMGDRADEVGLPLVQAHLAQEQDHDQDQAADQQQEEQAPQGVDDPGHPHHVPGHGQGDRHHDQGDPGRDVDPLRAARRGELRGAPHVPYILSCARELPAPSGGAYNQVMDEAEEAVRAVNDAFYAALSALDLERMGEVWLKEEWVRCVHPRSDLLHGWADIERSWAEYFARASWTRVVPTSIEVWIRGRTAIVICAENITEKEGAEVRVSVAIGTNVYQETEAGWRMVHHHASQAPIHVTQTFSGIVQ
jgi:uncharacterized protein (TIGR02246 family)